MKLHCRFKAGANVQQSCTNPALMNIAASLVQQENLSEETRITKTLLLANAKQKGYRLALCILSIPGCYPNFLRQPVCTTKPYGPHAEAISPYHHDLPTILVAAP
jgi:hypothetical protein